eukprot:SAG31_NODE_834_length_11650_cov_7.572245_9_plen_136_part_00
MAGLLRLAPGALHMRTALTLRPLAAAPVRMVHATPLARFAAPAGAPSSPDATYFPKAEVEDRVMKVCKDFEKVDPSKVKSASHFVNDLGLDSLDQVELVMAFEEEFVVDMDDAQAESIHTVQDAVKFFSEHPLAR